MDLKSEFMAEDGLPLIEVKMGIVLYLPTPAAIDTLRKIIIVYFNKFGSAIACFKSTTPGSFAKNWIDGSMDRFIQNDLHDLYRRTEWGYVFSDRSKGNSRLFMFHGFRPASQPGKASFLRFDFDDGVDHEQVRLFSEELITMTPFLSGSAGYFFFTRSNPHYVSQARDTEFCLARRYIGIEAQNIEVTAMHISQGLKCVNWITFIGKELMSKNQKAIECAKAAAYFSRESDNGILIQVASHPLIGDRNRNEKLFNYISVANALSGLQVSAHAPFGGGLWTEENTIEYCKRFNTI